MIHVYQFFNHPFFSIIGGLFALVAIGSILITFIFWVLGISPLLWRLGLGRWKRKIAIAASNDVYDSLKDDLVESGIFREKNVLHISKVNLAKIKDHYLILVHYRSFSEEEIKAMLSDKKSIAGMIFYYQDFDPAKGEKVPDNITKLIGSKENTTIVNFRGRLLNDIVTTLITTSYEKR
ncbi:MAG: hypothetical protein PHP37_04415 [Patescibacteria group bacterium]|nr:hypothetical protein [Acholeplasmataceae bacterium]MDD3711816.1 hypothetical protein [Patescibacteria group bacterium]